MICASKSIPEPKFVERSGGLTVVFRFKTPIGIVSKNEFVTTELNARQEIILSFIKEIKVASTQQILSHLISKLSNIPTRKTIIRDLNYLKSIVLIDLEGKKERSSVGFSEECRII